MTELRGVTGRAAHLTGPFELDLAAYHFLAQSAPESDHMVRWVRKALDDLLLAVGAWEAVTDDDLPHAPELPVPGPRDRALTGAAIVLSVLCGADTCDPDLARARITPLQRHLARSGARLALALGESQAERAWRGSTRSAYAMGASLS